MPKTQTNIETLVLRILPFLRELVRPLAEDTEGCCFNNGLRFSGLP